ncbi:hypothetical protein H5410_024929 [Solanum commersonii]|uniref:Uncharacterized protein n=1 Tax=Solanum commersonii TaxID=4109 RepID=A0A9J5ZNC2_SOLCO|nr:hypothetical protein H5410_024929 [Solanum commersonii]
MYSPYGYATYGADYVYPQGVYNPYGGQQYLPIYGVPGTVNATMYPYGQLSQAVPGSHSYTTLQGYAVPGHQILQFGGPGVNAMTASSIPTIQAPYQTGRSLLFVSERLLHHRHSLYYLLILLNLCKVAVLTKMQGEILSRPLHSAGVRITGRESVSSCIGGILE